MGKAKKKHRLVDAKKPNLVEDIFPYSLPPLIHLEGPVVEYIDGPNITRVMRKKAGFRGEEAAQIIADIASAVDIAHRRNVLHFDIRPSNILLNEERIPKLAGLGFSKVIEDAVVAESISIQHSVDTGEEIQHTGAVEPIEDLQTSLLVANDSGIAQLSEVTRNCRDIRLDLLSQFAYTAFA